MNENLSSFLIDLASDPGLMARFLSDPSSALDGLGLDARDQEALRSQDSERLRRALGDWSYAMNGQSMDTAVRKPKKGKGAKKKKKTPKKKPGKKR